LMSTILGDTFELRLDPDSNGRLGMERYDIIANVLPGTTKKEVKEMMRNLLKERFHLAYHTAPASLDAYNLVIAKGGPKLKDAALVDEPSPPLPKPSQRLSAMVLDNHGFPVLPAGRADSTRVTQGDTTRITFRMSTPAELGTALAFSLSGKRAIDKTGLTGKYD